MKLIQGIVLIFTFCGTIYSFGESLNAQGQTIDCAPNKRGSMSNLEETYCAGQDYVAADRELNRVYRLVLSENQSEANLIRQAQRVWVSYRDADCNAVGAGWGNGTGRSMAVAICKTELTNERAKRLRVNYLGER